MAFFARITKKSARAACVFALFALFGCGQNADEAGKIVVRLPGTLMQGLSTIPWSPQVPYLEGTLLEGLYGYDRNLNVVPKIAVKTEFTPDLKHWVFKLDSSKVWSNGDPVVAEDFVQAWLAFCSPEEATSPLWASFLMYVKNAEEYKAGVARAEEVGVRAPDSFTVVVDLGKSKDIRPMLVLPSAMPLHRRSQEIYGKNWWKPQNFVGNGPYVPVSFQPDDKLIVEKNPNYVGECGNVDRFEIKAGGLMSQMQNYQSGALDVAHVNNLGDYRYVLKHPDLRRNVREQTELGYNGYQISRTVNPLLHDRRIREALELAIDRNRIADTVMGGRVVPTGWYGPPGDSMLAGLRVSEYNPDSARRLLVESGYSATRPEIYMFAPPSNDYRGWGPVAEALYAMWKEVGFNVVIQPYEEGILNLYAWGTGFYPGPEHERPGMTMYTGKMLWKDPTMMLRLADHTWLFHNFPYGLKAHLKDLALQARQLKADVRGRGSEDDWTALDSIADGLGKLRARILENEPSQWMAEDIKEPDFLAQYARVRAEGRASATVAGRDSAWILARTTLFDAEDKLLKYSDRNAENLPFLRTLSELERASEENAPELVRKVQQEALDQAWIVPLYSEKLLYVARPWLRGEVLNKFGGWLCVFNLQYVEVDADAYFRQR